MSNAAHVPLATRENCDAFARAAEALARRRANEIPDADIEAFRLLQWVEWRQGALRVTPLGQMALIRIQGQAAQAA